IPKTKSTKPHEVSQRESVRHSSCERVDHFSSEAQIMKTHIRFSRHTALIAVLALAAFGATLATNSNSSRAQQASQSNPLSGLRWRNIGPFRGGRSVAVAGVASQPMVYYFGGTGGGVFKTTDGGANWEPVSDGQPFGT